jgi:MSHA biogenesis protein MshE
MNKHRPQKLRIGEHLINEGLITKEQLKSALATQKKTGTKLGDTLIELGFISSRQLLQCLARQLSVEYIELPNYKFEPSTAMVLPESITRRFRALVVEDDGNELLVAMADPSNLYAIDELTKFLKRPFRMAVVRETDLLRCIDMVYRKTDDILNIAVELGAELADEAIEGVKDVMLDDAPVVRLLTSLFQDAVQIGASDIHIEPGAKELRIRQRIDGTLIENVMNEKMIANALVSKLKLMSGLDISEKRLPQDGRFQVKVRGKTIDVRLSTMPLQHGESVVMRLLDQSGGLLKLEQIGMPEQIVSSFRNFIQRPHGMVLVTGPTGSGKTTTLYSAINELNFPEKKIITIEDPVEYILPRVNQVQVNTKIGLTFANVLRSALRQDPDIVLIGEMRDQETVEIGLRAAMTGHMVFSTLHTNDAISTAIRLLDMKAEGFLVASALAAVLAQRLVRRVCENCKTETPLLPAELTWIHSQVGDLTPGGKFLKGAGCPSCNQTGYRGRIGVFELLRIDFQLADALRRGDTAGFTNFAKKQPGFEPLAICTFKYAMQGITTMEEVLRISGQID